MSKKNKKNKKVKEQKTQPQRQQEIMIIQDKLTQLGLTNENPDVQVVNDRLTEFVNTGNSYTGKIKINGYKRIVQLILSNRPHVECKCSLQYNAEV
jgi:hypothetical protein